ncbi:MAG: DUF2948 family protein [Alphaproteobacteria bacterium]|nr:DUF2948 family protein [Alphaproteobacteria bacterium]
MGQGAPLRLRAESRDDLEVIAACLQDAIVAAQDIRYLPGERRFAFIANRFRWEETPRAGEQPGANAARLAERVLCGVVFETIESTQSRGIGRSGAKPFLDLLSIAVEPSPSGQALVLTFAGGAAIRLNAERIEARIEDLSEPWPTQWQPRHD